MKYVKFFDELRKTDVPLVGGKNSSLGELLSFGINVPFGFAVTSDAYDYVLDENFLTVDDKKVSLRDYISEMVKKITDD